MKLKRGDYCCIKNAYFWKMHNGKEKWVDNEELNERRSKCAKQTRELRAKNPSKAREDNRKNYHKDLSRSREYQKIWRQNNLEKRRKQQRDYNRNKRISDPLFLLKSRLKVRTASIFRRKSIGKRHNTVDILGCDWEKLKHFIESKFVEGMDWLNRDQWHIDHIVPLASANTEDRLIELCHYTNLQPLWASKNMSKGSKIILDYSLNKANTTAIV
jgi:hypothetical protein